MKKVVLTDFEGHVAEYLRLAEEEELIITHDGSRPESSLASDRRRAGRTMSWSTPRGSFNASRSRAKASGRGEGCGSKTLAIPGSERAAACSY